MLDQTILAICEQHLTYIYINSFVHLCSHRTGADTLVGKLTDKISKSTSHKLILAHMPLIMVCIEVYVYIYV